MNWITLFVIDIVSILIFALIVIKVLLYWDSKRQGEINSTIGGELLKLKFGRIFSFAALTLTNFSIFIHVSVFIILGLISGDYPGLTFNNGFAGIAGVILSFIFLIMLFFISVPNTIMLFQFFKYELGRKIFVNKANKTIELFQNNTKTIIENKDLGTSPDNEIYFIHNLINLYI